MYWFETSETIVEGVGFHHFDLSHILWLVFFVVFSVAMCLVYRKSSTEKRASIRKGMALAIVFNELFKTFFLVIKGNYTYDYLPLHLCSINVFIIAYHVYKPNKTLDNFLYAACLPGAIAALVAPSWVKLPVFNFMYLHSFTLHILLATYPMMLVAGGDIVPEIREFPKCVLFTILLAIPIYFVNLHCDTNFMFLMKADATNPLSFFEPIFGHHLFGVPIIEAVVVLVLYAPFHLFQKKEARD